MGLYYGQEKKYLNPNERGISHPMNLTSICEEIANNQNNRLSPDDRRCLKEAASLLEDFWIWSEQQKQRQADSLKRYQGRCWMCQEPGEIRNVDLYVIGSEGLNVCHKCEMKTVEFVRQQWHVVNEQKRQEMLERKGLMGR